MPRTLLTGNGAAAWGVRLAQVDYVPAFPITPQTEILEALGRWTDAGELDARITLLESEHSMVTAAAAAAATGVRVFTATSSQGLLYGMEMGFTVPGWRAPFVMVNVSRGLATPITLEPDHTDVLAARDSGFLQIHCSTCQEVLDQTLIAYRLAEHHRVRLPVIVNLDGFYLSFTREPVEIPDLAAVDRFLPGFDPETTRFRAGEPLSQGVVVLGSTPYSYFRYENHLAALQGLPAYAEIASEFAAQFGREYGAVEAYRSEDAEFVLVMVGSFATKGKDAVDRMRATHPRSYSCKRCLHKSMTPLGVFPVFLRNTAITTMESSSIRQKILHCASRSVMRSSWQRGAIDGMGRECGMTSGSPGCDKRSRYPTSIRALRDSGGERTAWCSKSSTPWLRKTFRARALPDSTGCVPNHL